MTNCYHPKPRRSGSSTPSLSPAPRRRFHRALRPRQLSLVFSRPLLTNLCKFIVLAIRSMHIRAVSNNPTIPTKSPLTGVGVHALDIPGIQALLETQLMRFTRSPGIRIQARRATLDDLKKPLITYVTDKQGHILIETLKHFNPHADYKTGIILLRYPDPITTPATPPGKQIYNEWYLPVSSWGNSYEGTPGEEWESYESKKLVQKEGLVITKEVIQLLGGRDGRAEVVPGWGGTMLALEGGLLVKDGSCIAPEIVERYFDKPIRVQTRPEVKAEL